MIEIIQTDDVIYNTKMLNINNEGVVFILDTKDTIKYTINNIDLLNDINNLKIVIDFIQDNIETLKNKTIIDIVKNMNKTIYK